MEMENESMRSLIQKIETRMREIFGFIPLFFNRNSEGGRETAIARNCAYRRRLENWRRYAFAFQSFAKFPWNGGGG